MDSIFNKVNISYNVIIGPEGDFSELELNALGSTNLTTVNLGPRRLRSETSVIAGLANINYSLRLNLNKTAPKWQIPLTCLLRNSQPRGTNLNLSQVERLFMC